jgi:Metallopeptidase toxin 3
VKMENTAIAQYPKFARCVKEVLPTVCNDKEIAAAMRNIAHLNAPTLQRAVQWGTGPDLKIVNNLGAFGAFTAGIKSNEIRISQKLVEDFEAGQRMVRTSARGPQHLAFITILHELCHWGDDQIGSPDMAGEDGEAFEAAVYGTIW